MTEIRKSNVGGSMADAGNTSLTGRVQELKEAAERDELTSLKNRRAMDQDLEYDLHQHIYLAIFDIDHFKDINDRLGHPYGDELIKGFAHHLRAAFGIGHCYRLGGDEFVVIGAFVSEEEFAEKYSDLKERLSHLKIYDNIYTIHSSCGYTHGTASGKEDMDRMMQEADHNLYTAKKRGRDRLVGGAYSRDDAASAASLDPVTGLYNANFFNSHAQEAIDRIFEQGGTPSVVYTDCYGTHAFNERSGYEYGDAMLRETGRVLKSFFNDGICTRYTDDRFAIVTAMEPEQIGKGIDQVNRALEKWSQEITAGLRAGVYTCRKGDHVLTALDRARRAKTYYDLDHVSRCHFYDDKVRSFVGSKDYLLKNLNRAVEEGWIKVVYQPVMGGISRKICALETLVRWEDPERGILLPKEFIPDLENVNLVHVIDLCVFRTVCRQIRERKQLGEEYVRVSVNLSLQTLQIPHIHEELNAVVDVNGLERSDVALELSGNGKEGSSAILREHFHLFRQDGYVTFCDHYGEGSSAMGMLQDLEYDFIKFSVLSLKSDQPRTRELLTSIVSASRSLGALPAAVGVETKEEADMLSEIGVALIEGFFIARPAPADRIFEDIRRAGYSCERKDESDFYLPIVRLNVLDGSGAFLGSEETKLMRRQPAAVISLEGDRFDVLYKNDTARRLESMSGHLEDDDMNDLLNQHPERIFLIADKLKGLTEVGQMTEYHAVTPYMQVHVRVQLIASSQGRRAFWVVGSDIREHGKSEGENGEIFRLEGTQEPDKAEKSGAGEKAAVFGNCGVSGKAEGGEKAYLPAAEYMQKLSDSMYEAEKVEDAAESIRVFLQNAGRSFHAERVCIFEEDPGSEEVCSCTYEWCREGVRPWTGGLKGIPGSCMKDWMAAFRAGQGLMIRDMQEYAKAGPEICKLLQDQNIQRLIVCPIMREGRVTGFLGVDNPDEECMDAGMPLFRIAANFISMQLRHLSSSTLISDLKNVDQVTGLRDISLLYSSLDRMIKWQQEDRKRWAIVCFNISQFKVYNNRYGFTAGNALLKKLGQVIREEAGSDNVCRKDADHFYAIVRDEDAEKVIGRVHDRMKEQQEHPVMIYAGIYSLAPESAARDALDYAKIASDHASGDFTRYFRRFTDEMSSTLKRNEYLISHVDEAVSRGWIKVYYQPIVDTISHKVMAAEALSRWIDPTFGFLSPAEFIGTLEDARLLYKVDLYVLETVCRDIRNAIDAGRDVGQISINLSRHDLEIPDLHEWINRILNTWQVPRDMIHLEITESALISNERIVQEHIRQFHKDGIEVWLDDFGSGYSSLNALQNYDFDCVKIDMKFLREKNERTPVLMESIVGMAKRLGMRTLSEGVEKEDEYRYLREIGCSLAQGYLFSKPVPIGEFRENRTLRESGIETAADRLFYRDIGRVNLLDAADPVGHKRHETETPFLILETVGERHRAVFVNQAFLQAWEDFSDQPIDGYLEESSRTDLPFYEKISDMIREADASGRMAEYSFVSERAVGRMTMQRVAMVGERRAYLMRLLNMTKLRNLAGRELSSVYDLYSLFDSIEEIFPAEDSFRHLYGELAETERSEQLSLYEATLHFAENYVHPLERDRYCRFLDAESMTERVERTDGKVLNSFFHIRSGSRTYEWKRLILAEVPGMDSRKRYIFCVTRNPAGWDQELLKLAKDRGLLPQDMEPGEESEALPRETSLWKAMIGAQQYGIFWKDKNRRFIGVNRTFLDYYNLTEQDLIGKTDEDMQWHPDPEPFRRDEERVLTEGVTVKGVYGKCLVKGEIHDIITNKAPVLQDGKIIGLIGYFMDVTDARKALKIDPSQNITDIETGLPNMNGLSRQAEGWIRDFEKEGKRFGVISIHIQQLQTFEKVFGRREASDLLRLIGEKLVRSAPGGAVTASFHRGRFVIICPAGEFRELHRAEKTLADALLGIRKTGSGIPVSVFLLSGSAMFSHGSSLPDTISLAEMNMRVPLSVREAVGACGGSGFRYTETGILDVMKTYMRIFAKVRLVNPQSNRTWELNSDGELYEGPYTCFSFLGKGRKCENCISLRTISDKKTYRKVEMEQGRFYRVISQYVEVDGTPYSLECIAEIQDYASTVKEVQKKVQ